MRLPPVHVEEENKDTAETQAEDECNATQEEHAVV